MYCRLIECNVYIYKYFKVSTKFLDELQQLSVGYDFLSCRSSSSNSFTFPASLENVPGLSKYIDLVTEYSLMVLKFDNPGLTWKPKPWIPPFQTEMLKKVEILNPEFKFQNSFFRFILLYVRVHREVWFMAFFLRSVRAFAAAFKIRHRWLSQLKYFNIH